METVSCVKLVDTGKRRRKCGKPVGVADIPINKNSRTGAKCRPLCTGCRATYDREKKKKRDDPSEAVLAAHKRGNKKRKGTAVRKAANKRFSARQSTKGTSVQAHYLVAPALNHILKSTGAGARFLAAGNFRTAAGVRTWFGKKAKKAGFPGGLADYGIGSDKWTVAHEIPKHAYDGLVASELSKCWHRDNMGCSTKSANSSQGRKFDEHKVPTALWPADWGGLPCTPARRAEIESKQAHLDE